MEDDLKRIQFVSLIFLLFLLKASCMPKISFIVAMDLVQNFFLRKDRPTYRPTYRPTNGRTKRPIEAPSRSLKMNTFIRNSTNKTQVKKPIMQPNCWTTKCWTWCIGIRFQSWWFNSSRPGQIWNSSMSLHFVPCLMLMNKKLKTI